MTETCFMSKGHAGKHQGYLAAPTSQGPPWCGEEVRADPYEAPDGYWTTDAPLSPEQVDEDMAAIRAMVIPRSITVQSAEVYVNGRLWNWKRTATWFGAHMRYRASPPADDPHAPHRAHIDRTRRQIKAEQDLAAPPSKKVKA